MNYHKTKDKSIPFFTPIFSSLKATNLNVKSKGKFHIILLYHVRNESRNGKDFFSKF